MKRLMESQHFSAVIDSLGLCMFTSFAWNNDLILSFLKYAFGFNLDMDALNRIGERIWNLERQFNLKAGLSKKDDTLPKRLRKDYRKISEKPENKIDIDQMLLEYYEQRGWSTEGVPKQSTLDTLDL